CVSGCRTNFEMDRGNWQAAEVEGRRSLDLADEGQSWFYLASALSRLCMIALHGEDWDQLHGLAVEGEEAARRSDRKQLVAHFALCQALAARCRKDELRGGQLFRTAVSRMSRLAPPGEYWFDTLAAYHERGGDLHKALAVRERELALIQDH